MQVLDDILISTALSALDPTPIDPTPEQTYFAHLVCKNLSDLCDTGMAILDDPRLIQSSDLPDINTIQMGRKALLRLYDDNMFLQDDEYGNLPNWEVIEKFPEENRIIACKVYRAIKNNLAKQNTKFVEAVKRRDQTYFLQEFEEIFADVPFKELLCKFRNFIGSSYIDKEDQETIWQYFEILVEMFMHEEENLEEIRHLMKRWNISPARS